MVTGPDGTSQCPRCLLDLVFAPTSEGSDDAPTREAPSPVSSPEKLAGFEAMGPYLSDSNPTMHRRAAATSQRLTAGEPQSSRRSNTRVAADQA